MFDDIELSNCPNTFALNCKRYAIKCHECKANDKGKHLLYLPINKSIKDHPAKNEPKKQKVSYSRKGKAQEQKTINKSEVLKRTIASGSYIGDGDAVIPMGDLGRVRVEHKTRFNNKNLYNPTSTELKEGYTQNIKVWYIVDGSSSIKIPRVFLKYNLFAKIISNLFTHEDTLVFKYSIPNSYKLNFWCSTSTIFLDYKIIRINRGLGLPKKEYQTAHSNILIANTSYGKFCYIDFYLFETLVKTYIELI